jgi:hypothetical protein
MLSISHNLSPMTIRIELLNHPIALGGSDSKFIFNSVSRFGREEYAVDEQSLTSRANSICRPFVSLNMGIGCSSGFYEYLLVHSIL